MTNLQKGIAPALAAALLMWTCSTSKETAQPHATSGIDLTNMDTTVRPGDNFFRYVNGNWVSRTAIPSDKSSYGIFTVLRDQAEDNVKAIIEESASGNFAAGSDEQKVGDFYNDFMNMTRRDSLGIRPLADEFSRIDAITDADALAAYFARANKIGNMIPFRMGVSIDFKNPKRYLLYTSQGGLGLPEREYYLASDDKSKKIREAYVAHVAKMLELASLPAPGEDARKIMELETKLATNHMKKEDARNRLIVNKKIPFAAGEELMPAFPWKAYWKEAGVTPADSINVRQVDYSRALNDIIRSTPLATWKSYLKWSALRGAATVLSSDFDREHFNFYEKTLTGSEEPRPLWRRAVSMVNSNAGEIVGKVYVKKHFPPQAKERMMDLVKNLLTAYEKSIRELDWMSEATKKEALDKLAKFTPKIGYPDKWKDYSKLEIKPGDLYGNKVRSAVFEYERNVERLNGPVDRTEWRMNPQTVNAYYMSTLNEIVFPAAILQPPFFDMNAEDAVNYGAIGAVIGHEIGHGFDDQGSTSDGDGVMRNWWTEQDLSEFKKRTGALVAQYNAFKVFDDLNVNGTYTLGENIGDLGGLSIALKAYRESLGGKPAPVIDGMTGEQRVFLGWGQIWRNKYREASLRNLVGTDPHSPSMFRVNGVVRNIPEFYSAFGVSETDSLYLPPEQRVKIW